MKRMPKAEIHTSPWRLVTPMKEFLFPFFLFLFPFELLLPHYKMREKKNHFIWVSWETWTIYICNIFQRQFFLIFFPKNFLNEFTVYVRLRQNPNFAMPSLMNKINKNKGYKTTQQESVYLNRSSCLQRVPGEEQTNCSYSKYLWNSLLSVCFNISEGSKPFG